MRLDKNEYKKNHTCFLDNNIKYVKKFNTNLEYSLLGASKNQPFKVLKTAGSLNLTQLCQTTCQSI